MKNFLFILFFTFPVFLSAQKIPVKHKLSEIVVTANKYPTPLSDLANSITVITRKQLEFQQNKTVVDVLRTVPGLSVTQQGGPGKLTSIFMRGANSNHVLVLYDGVELNNPASPNNGFDFSWLQVSDLDRIEIIRGPQSTLYGSEAVAGIINFISKTGKGKPGFTFSGEAGSNKYYNASATASGSINSFNYAFNFSGIKTDGVSAIKGKDFENDGYLNNSYYANLGYNFSKHLGMDLLYKFTNAKTDLDQPQPGGDDPNYTMNSENQVFNASLNGNFLNNKFQSILRGSFFRNIGKTFDGKDAVRPNTQSRSNFDGKRIYLDWQNNLKIIKHNIFTAGIDYKVEKASSSYFSESSFGSFETNFDEQKINTTGIYIQDQLKYGNFFATAGYRYDNNNKFGSISTFRIAPAYYIASTATKLKATYGTGFKAPSILNLFDPLYGNPDLRPETSKGWDAGIEQYFLDGNLSIGVTYFNTDFEDMITFDAKFKPVNLNKAKSTGIEITLDLLNIGGFSLHSGYTYNKVNDKSDSNPNQDDQLIRRPKNKFSASANYIFNKKFDINLTLVHNGEKFDNDFSSFPAKRVALKAYTLLNLAASYKLTNFLSFSVRIDNLLNTGYEEILYYGTLGRSFYGGLKIKL